MLSDIVRFICDKAGGYMGCDTCEIQSVCSLPNEAIPGESQTEKTAYWEEQMNKAAEAAESRAGG